LGHSQPVQDGQLHTDNKRLIDVLWIASTLFKGNKQIRALTRNKVMNGRRAVISRAKKINQGAPQILGAGITIGDGAMLDDHTPQTGLQIYHS
jgi:hypothetical protein